MSIWIKEKKKTVCFAVYNIDLAVDLFSYTQIRTLDLVEHQEIRCKSLFIEFDNLSTRFVRIFRPIDNENEPTKFAILWQCGIPSGWHIPFEFEYTESLAIFASINSFCIVWCQSTYELISSMCIHFVGRELLNACTTLRNPITFPSWLN